MKDIYINQNGQISRKDNSLIFKNENITKNIPVNDVNAIYCFGEVTLNSKLLEFLTQCNICVYFYNYFSFYCGVYAPREEKLSGKLLISQTNAYQNFERRLSLSKSFLDGAFHNMRKTLMQYSLNTDDFSKYEEKLSSANSINDLMLVEANMRQSYYSFFNHILCSKEFEFIKRVKQPPDNYINTLISFGNSLLYTTILSEIFKTQLNPTISYLHEPFERRYSLNLDISEIFKPLIVDRVIFTLVNKNMIKPEHFDKNLNYCYLNTEGRKLFLRQYDEKINQTIKHPTLKRNVSYRYLIRLECYKLIKNLLEGLEYKPFKISW